jgi:UDP-glucose 4-epimerase
MPTACGGPILVTGAAGMLGAAVADELLSHGRSVVALDRIAPAGRRGAVVVDDLSCRQRLEGLLQGVAGIVHCAAYATPQAAAEEVVFNGNVASTSNLLFAAEAAGVPRAVYASSQSALGLAYARGVIPPDYLPVDEEHPARPSEAYALSKLVGEQIGAMIAARSNLEVRCLRFPVIWSASRFAEHVARRLGDPAQAARSQWAYIDLRDAARACRLALAHAGMERFRVYNIAAPWPFACDDSGRLVAEAYATTRREGWQPGTAPFASTRATLELGFRAVWRWTPEGITEVR